MSPTRAAGLGLVVSTLGACASRPPHIPEREPPNEQRAAWHEDRAIEDGSALPKARLRMPPSRALVLDLVARFQSSIVSGEPPLEEVLAKTAALSAPTLEARRPSPSRSAISGALGSNFADPTLTYDPFEVSVTVNGASTVARVPLRAASGTSPRRIVMSLELRYAEGSLRIDQISLGRSP